MEVREYVAHDATGLAELVARGEVSAAEVLEAALSAIDARDPGINAFVARDDTRARAAVADGLPAGPLHGLRVGPNRTGSVLGLVPNDGVLVLPTMTVPARRSRTTSSLSTVDTTSENSRQPLVLGRPATWVLRSFSA